MKWTDLISKMDPLKTYYIDNLMQLTDGGSKEVLKAIRDAGSNIEKPLGKFRLSHQGEQTLKSLKNGSNAIEPNANRTKSSKF